MSVALTVLLIVFCLQGLVKFAVGFAVPYRTRITRIAAYYRRDGRIISIYDTVTLVIQIFFHRFSEPLTGDRTPEPDAAPRKIMSYAIQARPALAWREIALMTGLFGWSLYELIAQLVG